MNGILSFFRRLFRVDDPHLHNRHDPSMHHLGENDPYYGRQDDYNNDDDEAYTEAKEDVSDGACSSEAEPDNSEEEQTDTEETTDEDGSALNDNETDAEGSETD